VVAVADRLDSLVGLVAAVGAPSATADPYGLRRAAYGMLQVRGGGGEGVGVGVGVLYAAFGRWVRLGGVLWGAERRWGGGGGGIAF